MEQCDIDVDLTYLEINELKLQTNGSSSKRELDQNASNSNPASEEENPRRSLRKKIRSAAPTNNTERENRLSKHKKLVEGSGKQIIKYYLEKRVKRLQPSLETIFEEPREESVMSSRKFRRCIEFPATVGLHKDKIKTKKRTMKAKKVLLGKHLKKNKVSMALLMKTLATIEETDSNNCSDSDSEI